MAVTIKHTNYSFLEKIGVDPEYIAILKNYKILLIMGFFSIKFVTAQEETVGEVNLIKDANNIVKGKVSGFEMAQIKHDIMQVIANIPSYLPIDKQVLLSKDKQVLPKINGIPKNTTTLQEAQEDSNNNKETQPSIEHTQHPPVINKSVSTLPPDLVVKAPPVPLKNAKWLYQPVLGTDTGSKYFVIALNKEVIVAARVHAKNVSVRVECLSSNTEFVEIFKNLEITKKDGGYLSGHFACHNTTPSKLLGAILGGSNCIYDSPMPCIKYIENAK